MASSVFLSMVNLPVSLERSQLILLFAIATLASSDVAGIVPSHSASSFPFWIA